MSDPIVGKKVNGYRIQEVLGRGGMGVVYKAEDIALRRPVALKCLNPQLAGDESFLNRFRSEARAIVRISSPYIVQVFSLSETEIGLVIVMEYVEGRTLKQRIAAGETDWKESLPLIQQMLTALQHAHDAGVIHRDVKPHNILLSDIVLAHGIRVKMTDFGLAKVNTTGDPSRTVTEGVYGTLHYMSPEQVEGHGEIDHRSDIYSLGMTCYEMLAGRLPFDEDSSEYTIMRTIVEEDLPELGTFADELPNELQDIIMKAVAKDPAERFQSAAEMQDTLGELEASSKQGYPDEEPATFPADLGPPMQNPLTRDVPVEDLEVKSPTASSAQESSSAATIWRVAGAGVVLAAVLAGVGYFAVESGPTAKPKQEATAAVEQGTAGGTISDRDTTAETRERETDSTGQSSGGAPAEKSSGRASTGEQDSDAGPSGGKASNGQSGQSAGEQPSEGEAGEQAANTEAAYKRAGGAEAADTGENQKEIRKDLPPPIAALLDIDDPPVLSKRIDKQEAKGRLIRGDGPGDFFKPGRCYIFIVDREASRVEAVLGPKTNGIRVELRSGERIGDWDKRYGDNIQIWTELTSE